jgi:hypothetical protein
MKASRRPKQAPENRMFGTGKHMHSYNAVCGATAHAGDTLILVLLTAIYRLMYILLLSLIVQLTFCTHMLH